MARAIHCCVLAGYLAAQLAASSHSHAHGEPPGHAPTPHIHLHWLRESVQHLVSHGAGRNPFVGRLALAEPESSATKRAGGWRHDALTTDHDADACYLACASLTSHLVTRTDWAWQALGGALAPLHEATAESPGACRRKRVAACAGPPLAFPLCLTVRALRI